MPEYAPLEGNLRTDVLVVGGGIAGILCAWMLKQQGIDCTLIERKRICGGVTGNTTAKITSQHGLIYHKLLERFDAETARLYWQANEEALERYRVLAKSVECRFQRANNYVYATEDPRLLEQELNSLEKLRIPGRFSYAPELPFSNAGAVMFEDQARFDPLMLLKELVKDLRIYENTEARAIEGSMVQTGRGTVRAEKIIMATHFPILNTHGGYFLKMYQQRSYVLAVDTQRPMAGMYLDAKEQGISLRGDGDLLLVSGGGHRTGKQGGCWQALESFCKTFYPNGQERYRWAAQDCMTLDGIPYVGLYSKATPNLFVATGFNKWGMTNAMVSAMILSDMVQDRESPYSAIYSPQRTSLRAQLLINSVEAVVNLLIPTKPRCPHLGCALQWNRQEHSWDCPCHGSRFGQDGQLLDNPATGGLKKKP